MPNIPWNLLKLTFSKKTPGKSKFLSPMSQLDIKLTLPRFSFHFTSRLLFLFFYSPFLIRLSLFFSLINFITIDAKTFLPASQSSVSSIFLLLHVYCHRFHTLLTICFLFLLSVCSLVFLFASSSSLFFSLSTLHSNTCCPLLLLKMTGERARDTNFSP